MTAWPQGISAITLFVEDVAGSKQFYSDVFGLPVAFEDDASAVFSFGSVDHQPAQGVGGTRAHRAGQPWLPPMRDRASS